MNENEIEIRDLRLKLECANDMIEAYKRECDALYSAMVKWSRVAASGQLKTDEQQADEPGNKATDWLEPTQIEIDAAENIKKRIIKRRILKPVVTENPPVESFFRDKKTENSQEKIQEILDKIGAFLHSNFDE